MLLLIPPTHRRDTQPLCIEPVGLGISPDFVYIPGVTHTHPYITRIQGTSFSRDWKTLSNLPNSFKSPTSWIEIGSIYRAAGVTSNITTIGTRDTGGQNVLIQPALGIVSLVMWAVVGVEFYLTIPEGVINYVAKRNGSSHKLWINGIYCGEVINASIPFAPYSNPTVGAYGLSGWGANDSANGISLIVRSTRVLNDSLCLSISKSPWQIFESSSVPFYFNLSGTPTTTASGSLAVLSLTAPTATTVQTSIASGSLASISLDAPNATATTVSTTIASGSLAAISLSAPNATTVQTSIASGSLASISLTAPTATVSTVSATTASGSLAAITLTAPTATTVQTSIASGSLASISLTAPTATVSTVASVIASGNIVAININAPAAQAVLSVKGTGYFSPMTLIAPNHVLAPSTTVPEIVNFDTMIQREVSFDTLITRTVSYTVER